MIGVTSNNTNNIATIATNTSTQTKSTYSVVWQTIQRQQDAAPHDDAEDWPFRPSSRQPSIVIPAPSRTSATQSRSCRHGRRPQGGHQHPRPHVRVEDNVNDPTKNDYDLANYNTEFKELQRQLVNINDERFNGINLFHETSDLSVSSTEDGVTGTVNMTRNGLFDNLAKSGLAQTVIASAAYVATNNR